LANALIRNNQRRSGRQLIPIENEERVTVQVIQWPDMQSEAEGIADFIAARVQAGDYEPGETLILCPRYQFGCLLRDELRNRKSMLTATFMKKP
jgi:superfamily I DNA/RNA helicase